MVCFFQQSWEADLGRHIDMSVHVGSLRDMQDESEIGRYVEKEEFLSIFSFVSRYVAKHRVVGRAKIQRLLNPSALFDLNEKQVQGFVAALGQFFGSDRHRHAVPGEGSIFTGRSRHSACNLTAA